MTNRTREEIEDLGEETGRGEAQDAYPYLPLLSQISDEVFPQIHRNLIRRGRGRAQGDLYGLQGKEAHWFAQAFAIGYLADWRILEEEGHLEETE